MFERPESSVMAVYECIPAINLLDMLRKGYLTGMDKKCIHATLIKAYNVSLVFQKFITEETVRKFLDSTMSDSQWETMDALSLLTMASHKESGKDYSFSHAQWFQALRHLKLRWSRIKEDSEKNSEIRQMMSRFYHVQSTIMGYYEETNNN